MSAAQKFAPDLSKGRYEVYSTNMPRDDGGMFFIRSTRWAVGIIFARDGFCQSLDLSFKEARLIAAELVTACDAADAAAIPQPEPVAAELAAALCADEPQVTQRAVS